MEHAYDFYKPCGFYPLVGFTGLPCKSLAALATASCRFDSPDRRSRDHEPPRTTPLKLRAAQVDGKSSVACYLMALDKCYASLCEKFERCRSNFERQRRLARSSSESSKGNAGGGLLGRS